MEEKKVRNFDSFDGKVQGWAGMVAQKLNELSVIVTIARHCPEADIPRDEILAMLDTMEFGVETRHRKAQIGLIREALVRFWTEKDAGVLPEPSSLQ